jgi:hypothetical protein
MNTSGTSDRRLRWLGRRPALIAALMLGTSACAQQPSPPEATVPPVVPAAAQPPAPSATQPPVPARLDDGGAFGALAWLEGCWQGTVNQREFREHWLPPRGGMLIGAGQSVLRAKVQDYEFLRIEPRSDGIYFSQFGGDRQETSFRLDKVVNEDKDTIFTFANTDNTFPARLIYRRGTEGWLYETIEGKMNGADRQVIYPMRRVDCETSELINK